MTDLKAIKKEILDGGKFYRHQTPGGWTELIFDDERPSVRGAFHHYRTLSLSPSTVQQLEQEGVLVTPNNQLTFDSLTPNMQTL